MGSELLDQYLARQLSLDYAREHLAVDIEELKNVKDEKKAHQIARQKIVNYMQQILPSFDPVPTSSFDPTQSSELRNEIKRVNSVGWTTMFYDEFESL